MSTLIQKPTIQRTEAFGFAKNQILSSQGKSTHNPTTVTTTITSPTTSFTCTA